MTDVCDRFTGPERDRCLEESVNGSPKHPNTSRLL